MRLLSAAFLALWFSLSCFSQSSTPAIERKGETYTLTIPEAMKKALSAFNPRFQHWLAEDYCPEVRHGGPQSDLKVRAPFALIIDVNQDGTNDLILDGRDDRKSMLVAVVSKRGGYDVLLVRERDLLNPREIQNQFEGKKEIGFDYYLWRSEKTLGFMLAWPQQSDASGALLNDGGMIEFQFSNGRFVSRNTGPL